MYDTVHLNANTVKMVAHRGVSGLETENTASAFVAAGNRSYWGVETDVHVTKDGQFVIIHDDNTQRVAKENYHVEETDMETLRSLTLLDKTGEKTRKDLMLPTLAEYISVCKKYNKNCVLELKNHMENDALDGIRKCVQDMGWLDHTVFISFDLANLVYMREKLPHQPMQYLAGEFGDDLVDTLKKYHLDLDIYFKALKREHVELLHKENILVNVWTVDELSDGHLMASYGVDFITSNIME